MLAGVKPKDPEQIFAQGAEPKQEETVDNRKTNAQIAEQAGVSRETIRKVEKIEQKATPEIKAALKAGEISINEGYKAIKRADKIKSQQEQAERKSYTPATRTVALQKAKQIQREEQNQQQFEDLE